MYKKTTSNEVVFLPLVLIQLIRIMKKIIPIVLLAFFNINCSSGGDDSSPAPKDPDTTTGGKSVAVNDRFDALEDTDFSIENLLSNDTIEDNARITAFDATTTQGGSIVDNRNATYTYTPADDFTGEDTFTYTICDTDTPPDCSTATVTINVADFGSPVAENDAINVLLNTPKTITTLLDNDSAIDEAVLSSVDTTATQGTVVLNADGTVDYTPPSGFTGTDSFTYALCDDDIPTNTCVSATVTITVIDAITFNIPAELVDYYSGVIFSEDADLMFEELDTHTTNKHTTILTYIQRHHYLYDADADLSSSNKVVLMYSGERRFWREYTSGTNSYSPQTYNTEHVYPQSLLNSSNSITDLHHLRTCDDATNTRRSNNPFGEGSGTYELSNNEWYPGDEWRGDVARMMMYLNIRYGENFDLVGGLDLFISWNRADPVSDFEIQRNNVIYSAQGNRNPFIDNPYLATLIWGGAPAENKWN